jgi:excisionase family DNA binding protein
MCSQAGRHIGVSSVKPQQESEEGESFQTCALPPACTVAQVAVFLRLNARTVREMFHRGELTGGQRGHAIRISRGSVLDWLSGKRPVSLSRRNR